MSVETKNPPTTLRERDPATAAIAGLVGSVIGVAAASGIFAVCIAIINALA